MGFLGVRRHRRIAIQHRPAPCPGGIVFAVLRRRRFASPPVAWRKPPGSMVWTCVTVGRNLMDGFGGMLGCSPVPTAAAGHGRRKSLMPDWSGASSRSFPLARPFRPCNRSSICCPTRRARTSARCAGVQCSCPASLPSPLRRMPRRDSARPAGAFFRASPTEERAAGSSRAAAASALSPPIPAPAVGGASPRPRARPRGRRAPRLRARRACRARPPATALARSGRDGCSSVRFGARGSVSVSRQR